MDITGYLLAMIIGLSLGLVGGGGSILTVPILVYVMGIDPVLATAYSLFVVGSTALVGAGRLMMRKLVSYRTAAVFAIPSFIAVYLTRLYLVPAIPPKLFEVNGFVFTKDMGIMVFFAIIMLMASISMIRNNRNELNPGPVSRSPGEQKDSFNYIMIVAEGLLVGFVTGIVGAGGGFLIIPALVLLAKLPMKYAVATSLLIIAVKSLLGFLGDIGANQAIDWSFLLIFTGFAIAGIFAGTWLTRYISGMNLRKGFGWFVLLMACFIIVKELI